MKIAFIGAGRLAQTLAPAFYDAGFEVVAVAARNLEQGDALARTVPGCTTFADFQQAADVADLVFVAVRDDAIAPVTQQIRWRPEQAVVHFSGATDISALNSAAVQGARIGGFHPLQLFADPDVARRGMAGCSVAIEAEGRLEADLEGLAHAVGYRVIKLPPGVRARYHCATNYAASFLLSLLREACDLWNSFGVSDEEALKALLPLARGALETADAKGLAMALAGPFSRGDAEVVARHMDDLSGLASRHLDLYRNVSLGQLRLARERGHLDDDALARLEAVVQSPRTPSVDPH